MASGPQQSTPASDSSGDVPTMAGSNPAVTRAGRQPTVAAPGSKIGRFEVVEALGQGGMGLVYLAVDPSLGRRVAVKLLHAEVALQTRLEREARALAALSHPNVVVVYEVGTDDGRVFVAMEYVRGETLSRWSAAHAEDWRALLAMFVQAGRGVAAAHKAGIVHRDFKPDNVIVGFDGRARVLDFGLAGIADGSPEPSPIAGVAWQDKMSLTASGAVMGTPRYMAPEQHLGLAVDGQADQFAFCVALSEALYGAPPFEGQSYSALRAAVLGGQPRTPPPASQVPAEIRDAVARGLCLDPAARHPSMDALLEALQPRAKRRIGGTMAAVGAAVGLGAVAIVIATRPPADSPPAQPAAPNAVGSPLPRVRTTTLTRTDGTGVTDLKYDAKRGAIVYRTAVDEAWWSVALDGGVAEPYRSPHGGSLFAFDGGSRERWSYEGGAVVRRTPGGIVGILASDVLSPTSLAVSGDGETVALTVDTGVLVLRAAHLPRHVPLPAAPSTAALSPTGHRIAVLGPAPAGSLGLWLVTRQSAEPMRQTIDGSPSGAVWVDDDTLIVALTGEDRRTRLQCQRVASGRLVNAGTAVEPVDDGRGFVLDSLVALPGGDLLALGGPWSNGVAVVPIDGGEIEQTAPESLAAEHSPWWRPNGTLAFVSDRSRDAVVVAAPWNRLGAVETLDPTAVHWATGDGVGGVLLRPQSAPATLAYRPQGASVAETIAQDFPRGLQCISPRRCVGVDIEDEFRIVGYDLETRTQSSWMACPPGMACFPRHIGLSPDGERVLLVRRDGEGFSVFRRGGEHVASGPTPPSGGHFITGAFGGGPDQVFIAGKHLADFVLWRVDGIAAPVRVWSSDRTFVTDPRMSPAADRVALTSVTKHQEVVRLSIDGLCPPP
ncbi:MAG: serine/threonine-protein kinase [Myxococcota bacterium]